NDPVFCVTQRQQRALGGDRSRRTYFRELSHLDLGKLQVQPGHGADDDEDQRGDGGGQGEVLPRILEGNAVGVADQQIGGAGRRGGAEDVRPAAREQGDQHEVVEVEGRSEEHTSELQSRENLVCRL